uniref:Protein kinase domain-containing protein n=1 Tax=Setaria digitata TaxID=48799 RepID=A0A915Q3H0_9BILA
MSSEIVTEESSISEKCMDDVDAVMNCSFCAVKTRQISGHRGEKVKILNIDEEGYAKVEKEDGEKGYIPTYFLDLNTVPGNNFAEQIRYRRKWYHLVDSGQAIIFKDNPSNLLNNISYLTSLISFLPVQKQSFSLTLPSIHKRPICIEPLQDLRIKLGEKLRLMCKFFSEESHTITWRGPVITAKRYYDITTNDEGYSMLTLKNCTAQDGGQYWVEAKNIFGKCHTVAWITVIVPPGVTHFTICKAISRNTVLLQWKDANGGNSKNVHYVIEYKRKDMTDYKIAMEGITGTSTIITDLKPSSYSFRIYAFNEYFKGEIGQIVQTDLDLSYLQSLSSFTFADDINAEIVYMDETEYTEIYTIGSVIYKGQFADIKQIIRKTDKKQYAAKYFMRELVRIQHNWVDAKREIGIAHFMRHRNIVTYCGAVKINNQPVMIMQWLNGPHLLDYITRLGYISEILIQRFCKDLLLALEYLHSFQIVHLAIQPENLVTHASNIVRLVVIDFGSSRRCNGKTVVWNNDSVCFAAPEQISHHEVTTKADIWSFGIVLHVLTTGKIPFDDKYYEVMRLKILSNISTIDEIQNYRIHSPAIISLLKSIIITDAR